MYNMYKMRARTMRSIALVTGVLTLSVFMRATAAPDGGAATAAGDPLKGQKIFALQKCATCHPMNGVGMKLAPDLGAIGSKRDAAWLAKFLVNPTTLDPKNPPIVKMMPVKLKGQDLDDLIAYLLTLKAKK
jgi:mono/diheme cytochrome c family protein